jgi:PAS domain S-box-containing protein
MKLPRVVRVNEDKCVNCHKCIAVCPVKFCNNGIKDHIELNEDLCIGCGECIKACTHDARIIVDDFELAMEVLENGEKIIAIVAPSVAANFPEAYLNFNGWLKSLGIEALFDVSFGAELTVKSFVEYIKEEDPEVVISSACPAIVTFIELYHPELIEYIAPVDSPMLHTMKMIRKFYPQYEDYKIAIISPCIAKKREFLESGIGDFNVTMAKIHDYIEEEKIDLSEFPKTGFDNDPAERAVVFPTPGGLLKTAEREWPQIREKTRKIENVVSIFPYLANLHEQIEKSYAPLLVDCLNCELGCNGGTGTHNQKKSPDELEYFIEKRMKAMEEFYQKQANFQKEEAVKNVETVIDKYWEKDLYKREYHDSSDNFDLKIPTEEEFQEIQESMLKFTAEDKLNCGACGYEDCEGMAIAIFNGLNKKENCYFYMHKVIKASEEKYRSLMNNLSVGVYRTTPQNKKGFVSANPAMAAIFGYDSVEEFLDSDVINIYKNPEDRKIFLNMVKEQGYARKLEWEMQKRTGENIWVSINEHIEYDEDGEIKWMDGIIEDITERKEIEEELEKHREHLETLVDERTKELKQAYEEVKRLEQLKSEFLSTVSHELRTPLTSILGFAKIIKKNYNKVIDDVEGKITHKKVKKYIPRIENNLDIIIKEGDRLTRLINDVLDLSKIESGKMQWNDKSWDANEIIEEVVDITTGFFLQNKNVKFINTIEENLGSIQVDKDRIVQVINNLISNSMKFTNEGHVKLEVFKKNGNIQVEIEDTGSGITKKDQEKVFEKFRQVGDTLTDKPTGTGLGLPICKEIIEHYGGTIWVESELGEGSTFKFTLPLEGAAVEIEPETEEEIQGEEDAKSDRKKVLVVDDEMSIRQLISQILQERDYKVLEAKDGQEAIVKARKFIPDLILCDIMMPGLSGYDVIKILKDDPRTKDIPVIIVSILEDKERGLRLGIEDYFSKPIDEKRLLGRVSDILSGEQNKIMLIEDNKNIEERLKKILGKGKYQIEVDRKFNKTKIERFAPDVLIIDVKYLDKELVENLKNKAIKLVILDENFSETQDRLVRMLKDDLKQREKK